MTNFQVRIQKRGIAKDVILEDIKRVAKSQSNGLVTAKAYAKQGSFGVSTAIRLFGSWNSAVRNAGLKEANRQDISDAELLENIANVWKNVGHQPYITQMSDPSIGAHFSKGTYEKRFGNWTKALLAFEEFLNSSSGSTPDEDKLVQISAKKRTARSVNWRLRAKILIRDNCICKMCGASPAKNPETVLHVDHIIPWSKGGETVEENLQTLCEVCNLGKSNVL